MSGKAGQAQGADYDAAVDAVWSSRAKEVGVIFETNYWSGNKDEGCGVGLNGWQSRQWGTKACAEAGWSWQDIVTLYYYPDVCVTPWTQSVPAGDYDCDRWSTADEVSITTFPYSKCGITLPGVPSLYWPPDLVWSNAINISDVLALKPVFGQNPGPARYDLVPGGGINISDVLTLKPVFGSNCLNISFSTPGASATGEGSPPGSPAAGGGGSIQTVAIDADPFASPANTATSLGSREECVSTGVGNSVSIDVTVASVPEIDEGGGGLNGMQFTLTFDSGKAKVTGNSYWMLLAANGGILVPFGDAVPDTDGSLVVAVGDFGSSTPESSEGVLARITLEALGEGTVTLGLEDVTLVDGLGNEYAIGEVLNGCLEIGSP